MEKYVITGGPCVGKTTLVEALEKRGYVVVPEAARQIIQEEQKKFDGILPWKSQEYFFLFQQLVVKRQLDLEASVEDRCCFLDRSIVDGVAYCHLAALVAPEELGVQVQHHRYDSVFLLDRLPYKQDAERKEDEATAQRIHEMIREVYTEGGYDIISVPVFPVEQRVDFVLNKIKEINKRGGCNGRML